jgi:hypothetical protein
VTDLFQMDKPRRPEEAHTVIVHAVGWPDGPDGDYEFEYDVEHAPSCTWTDEEGWEGVTDRVWDCRIPDEIAETGPAYVFDPPITRPGTYTVERWSAEYWTDCGWEYDGGLTVVSARPASHGHCKACHPEQAPATAAVNGHEYARRRKARQRRSR